MQEELEFYPNIRSRVEKAFSDAEERRYGDDVIQMARDNLRDYELAFIRSVTITVLLMLAFELLVRAAIGRLSIGPFELEDLSLVRKLLPVVIAYYLYDIVVITERRSNLRVLYRCLFQKLHRPLYDGDIEELLLPRSSPIFGPTVHYTSQWVTDLIENRLIYVPAYCLYLAPLVFLCYAYYVQFREFGPGDVVVWLTLLASAFLIIYAVMIALNTPTEEDQLAEAEVT